MKNIQGTILATLICLATFSIAVLGATSDTTQVTVTLENQAIDVYALESLTTEDPTEASTTTVTWDCSVNDPDGNAHILTVNGTASFGGESEVDSACAEDSTVNATAKIYTCSVDLQFYYDGGTWDYDCYAYDEESSDSMADTFTYNELDAWTMTPTSISFGNVNIGQTDIGATDDPIVLTNTGNTDLSGNVQVTSYDLAGVTNPSDEIPVSDCTVNVADSEGGDALVDSSGVTVTGTSLDRGISSTEGLYFYIETVATGIDFQVYNTVGNGEWTISASSP